MKRFYFILFVCCAMITASAQQLTVKSMQAAGNDISASTYVRLDAQGNPCALVKVLLPVSGMQFEGNVVGNIDNRAGEYWVYMNAGSQELRVKATGQTKATIRFADYGVQPVQGKATYVVTISRGAISDQPTTAQDCKLMADDYYVGYNGKSQNYAEAAKWYRKAAEQGDQLAQYNLGIMYSQGQGVTTDINQAATWYLKSAQNGYSAAQYNLGSICYANKDFTEALKWFHKAADQGEVSAMYNLGIMYADGEGVKQNTKESIKWLQKAAESGHVNAQYNLGTTYLEGAPGQKRDLKQARIWMMRAAAQGDEDAKDLCRKLNWQ